MTREVPLSLLVRQHLALKDEFPRRYPNAWLVWEAGAWSVPAPMDGSVARTHLPADELKDCLPVGDVLCFELPLQNAGSLKLGRAEGNDVVIQDATVSREHVVLSRNEAGEWKVVPAEGRSAKVGEQDVAGEVEAELRRGDRLQLGEVTLTFYDADSFVARVSDEGQKLLDPALR